MAGTSSGAPACDPLQYSNVSVGGTAYALANATATDVAGNISPTAYQTAVIVSGTRNIDGVSFSAENGITVVAGGELAHGVTFRVDGAPPEAGAVVTDANARTTTLSLLTRPGPHFVEVTVPGVGGAAIPTIITFTVAVSDTILPVLTLPTNITTEATGRNVPGSLGVGTATVIFTATAIDDIDGLRPVTCLPSSGSVFKLGSTTVTCDATDLAGNKANQGSFTVTVVDTTAPDLTIPANIGGIEASGPAGATVNFTATATDIADPDPVVVCTPASGSTFGLGNNTVSCTATDDSNNFTTKTFTVTVVDTTKPVIRAKANVTIEGNARNGANVSYAPPLADDAVTSSLTVTCLPAAGFFSLGTTTVRCDTEDAAGNKAQQTLFTVTVTDITPPVISNTPGNVAPLEGNVVGGRIVNYTPPTAFDTVDGVRPVTCLPASGTLFPVAVTTVTCSASDTRLIPNSASTTFTVSVRDTTAPNFPTPANISVTATVSTGIAVAYTPTATDLVKGPVTPVCLPASGSNFVVGITTVSCTATDDYSNAITKTFTVTVAKPAPTVLTGHMECYKVNSLFPTPWPYWYEVKNGAIAGTYRLTAPAGTPQATATILANNGKIFNWTSNYPIDAVIVVSRTQSNIYRYANARADSGLTAPPINGLQQTITEVSFCHDGK